MTETREQKAQRLVDENRVHIRDRTPRATDGSVHGDSGNYHVICYSNGTYFCSCPWFRYNADPEEHCSHALALKMLIEKEEE